MALDLCVTIVSSNIMGPLCAGKTERSEQWTVVRMTGALRLRSGQASGTREQVAAEGEILVCAVFG